MIKNDLKDYNLIRNKKSAILIYCTTRQMEGIARAKTKGVYKGRKSNINVEKIKSLKDEGMGATAIARELGIHRDSVYRLLKTV